MSPLSPFSQLALVPIFVAAATPLMTATFIYIFVLNYDNVGRPILDFFTKKGGGWVGGLIRWVTRPVTSRITNFVREHVAALRRLYWANQAMFAISLDSTAEVVNRVAGTLGDMSEQTWRALWTLNNETIPRKINAALAPIRQTLTRHTQRLDAIEDLNRRVSTEIGTALQALPWGAAGTYVGNFNQWLDSYRHLWAQVFGPIQSRLNELYTQTVPQILERLERLERGGAGGVGQALQGLRNRVEDLERWRENVVMPRLQALEQTVDTLATSVLGDVGEMLRPMLERIIELERHVTTLIPEALQALRDDLEQLRTELEEGIATGLEVFRERIGALELEVFTQIPQRLDAMQLALDTLAAEVFTEVGAGLSALTERIVGVERFLADVVVPRLDLAIGRIEGLEADIRDNVLPRLRALEDILAPAAFAALVLATLRVAAPNLFCRNVTRTTQAICGLDEGWIDDLLSLGLPILVLADLCDFMRLIRAAAGPVVSLFSPLVLGAGSALDCGGAGAPGTLPLNTTALPTPTAALAL